jgi:hypothetical protein
MDSIYPNCAINIVAADARDARGGCFFKRSKLVSAPCVIELEKNLFVLEEDYRPHFSVNSRAWVFQERLLSQRVLSFAEDDVLWHCTGLSARGKYPDGDERWIPRGKYHDSASSVVWDWEYSDERLPPTVWRSLIEAYTKTQITKRADRLPAMGAIAKCANEAWMENQEYVVGNLDANFQLRYSGDLFLQ